jgi:hypothetical protein
MRLALAHTVEIKARLDGKMPALELARGSAIERFAARGR